MINDRLNLKLQIKKLQKELENYRFANGPEERRLRATIYAQISLLKKRLNEYIVSYF